MDAAQPAGAYVAMDGDKRVSDEPVELHKLGCHASSEELLDGTSVSETEMDTLPGELIDEFDKAGR